MTLLHPRDTALLHYAAGSTGESARRRLAQHLADCDRCRRVVVSTRELRATLAGASEIASSDALLTRILTSRAAGARVLLPVESPPEAGANRAARPALWIALAGAAAIAFVSVVPKGWVPSATSSGTAEIPAHRGFLPTEFDATIPAAGPIDPSRMHEVTLRYGIVQWPSGKPAPGMSTSYRFVRSGAVGSDWILISENHLEGFQRSPDSIWIDAATLQPTRRFGPGRPGVVYNQAHFIALMMTMPLTQHWRGRFSWRFAKGLPYGPIQITGSRSVITGAGKFDCWEAADRGQEATYCGAGFGSPTDSTSAKRR